MATDQEKAELRRMIRDFYSFANVPVWDGEVNDAVAHAFFAMLTETKTCSAAFNKIPTPPSGRATITWLIMQLGRGVFHSYRGRLSFACARAALVKWKSQLELASLGIASSRPRKYA